ncbi:hypothetical protein A2U01_0088510, partial [Trifolium medium]|nr:hypothetical protein [Trifolium medium]
EGRSKMKHDKESKQNESSGTDSDDIPLTQKLKQKTSKAYAQEMHKKFSTDQIPGFDIPLTTVLPETQPINLSSSTSVDTAELD